MNISIKDKIGLSETLVRIYSKVLGKNVGYIKEYEYYGEDCEYNIEIDYTIFGFKSNIFLWYKAYLRENLYHEKELTLLKIELLKALAEEYQTDVLADFPFPQENFGNISYHWSYFLSNKKGELFEIIEEPYPSEELSKEYDYTEDEISDMGVGIVPLYDTATRISEEEMRKEIIFYFDQKIKESK